MTDEQLFELLQQRVRTPTGEPRSAAVERNQTSWEQMWRLSERLHCRCIYDRRTGRYEVSPWLIPDVTEFQVEVYRP